MSNKSFRDEIEYHLARSVVMPDHSEDPTPYNPDSEEDQNRITILDDVIRTYGARWIAGALKHYISDKVAHCACSSTDPCYRCLLREHLGLPEDRYTRAELLRDFANRRAEEAVFAL